MVRFCLRCGLPVVNRLYSDYHRKCSELNRKEYQRKFVRGGNKMEKCHFCKRSLFDHVRSNVRSDSCNRCIPNDYSKKDKVERSRYNPIKEEWRIPKPEDEKKCWKRQECSEEIKELVEIETNQREEVFPKKIKVGIERFIN